MPKITCPCGARSRVPVSRRYVSASISKAPKLSSNKSPASALPPVALLAGGLATRLRPLSETIPKALIDVAGKPMAARQVQLLHRKGIRRIVFCVGYLGEMIQAFL